MVLPSSHPLILELDSLRSQLAQYQNAAQKSGIQLQTARLEASIAQSRVAPLKHAVAALQAELATLRSTPLPPSASPHEPNGSTGTALSELSLAHRRLSAKMDATEQNLQSSQLELAAARQEIQRLTLEKEDDRAKLNELRRREGEWEEEMLWEKTEKRKAEEQKKLCDLAIKEYQALVASLDPSALPPHTPMTKSILSEPPTLATDDQPHEPVPSTSSADDISNLLIGQKGVHQLVQDFVSTMTAKDAEARTLNVRIDDLELSLSNVTKQLEEETQLRVQYMCERDRALQDDASAAKVVERYMTFTQKTHKTMHMHLEALRARSGATQNSLRKEVLDLQTRLRATRDQAQRLAAAMDETSESVARESSGRRREVALRLRMIAEDEQRGRKVEKWLDRVRRAREGAEGAVLEPDRLEVLLDEGVEALEIKSAKRKAWKGLLGRKRAPSAAIDPEEESVARVLLAEELVNTLVQDLQTETERRMELERQRIGWITREALSQPGVQHEPEEEPEQEGELMFDAADVEDEVVKSPALTESPLPSPAVSVDELKTIFEPLDSRYAPMQETMHSLTHSLSALRQSLNEAGHVPSSPLLPSSPILSRPNRKFPTLKPARKPLSDPILHTILDNLHETIEDARVDAEIALADEERVYRGFEALLNVGKTGTVRSGDVLQDARDYVEDRTSGDVFSKLQGRVSDIEKDVGEVRAKVMELLAAPEAEENWADLSLLSVTVQTPTVELESPLSPNGGERRGPMGVMGSMGRSFSSSIVGAPRKVSGFAGGLYRQKEGKEGNGMKAEEKRLVDDVE